jgi:hypothetical protein
MFNPKTHEISTIDSDGNKSKMDFDEFINTLQTANTDADRTFISSLEDYEEKSNAPKSTPVTPKVKGTALQPKVQTTPIWKRTP